VHKHLSFIFNWHYFNFALNVGRCQIEKIPSNICHTTSSLENRHNVRYNKYNEEFVWGGSSVFTISIKYNPYKVQTIVDYKGKREGSKFIIPDGMRLQEWVENLPKWLEEICRGEECTVIFDGTDMDFNDILTVIDSHKKQSPKAKIIVQHVEKKINLNSHQKLEEVRKLCNIMKKSSFKQLNNSQFLSSIEEILDTEFEINTIGVVSAGKSTLINALLRTKLLPMGVEPLTARITRIKDSDNVKSGFDATVYSSGKTSEIKNLNYDIMEKLNADKRVEEIHIEGKIPFIDSSDTKLVLVDSPGTNRADDGNTSRQDEENHRDKTYRAISDDSRLILFVIRADSMGVDDENELFKEIAKRMKKGNKVSRDRFIFAVNKMDELAENNNPEKLLESLKNTLSEKFGIEAPRMFPIYGRLAYEARTKLTGKSKGFIDDIQDNLQFHLYRSFKNIDNFIPLKEREKIEALAKKAEEDDEIYSKAIVYSGIMNLESAIQEYIEKYAICQKINDACVKITEAINSITDVVQINYDIASDDAKRNEIEKVIASMKKKLASGESGAKKYEKKINEINFLDRFAKIVTDTKNDAHDMLTAILDEQHEPRLSEDEANKAAAKVNAALKSLSSKTLVKLENLLDKNIKTMSENLMNDFKKDLSVLLELDSNLPFNPLSMVAFELDTQTLVRNNKKTETKTRTEHYKKPVKRQEYVLRKGANVGFWDYINPKNWWRKETVTTYENATRTHTSTENYVSWVEISQDVARTFRKHIDKLCENTLNVANKNSSDIKDAFLVRVRQVNKKLNDEMTLLQAHIKNANEKEKDIERKKREMEQSEKLLSELNAIKSASAVLADI